MISRHLLLAMIVPALISGNIQTTSIASGLSGKCLDIAKDENANGVQATQWSCWGGWNQKWTIRAAPGGLQIINAATGKCLDVEGKSRSSGAKVHQWACQGDSGHSQVWMFKYERAARGWTYWRIVNRRSGKCLDVPQAAMGNGVRLWQWDCNSTAAQSWRTPSDYRF